MSRHREKTQSAIERFAAEYLNREASARSIITVTGSRISEHSDHITILLSVLPAEEEENALDFAKRRTSDFREYLKTHVQMRALPIINFAIDRGEKNRQRIEELLKENPKS